MGNREKLRLLMETAPRGLSKTFRAFSYRDYRLLWTGAFISSCGTWMQQVAQAWLVLTLTGSAFWLGFDAFLGQAPFLAFSLIGGVVADRMDRRRILLVSQVVQMADAFLLAALIFVHRVAIWHILALSFVTGLAQSFGGPAYQALVPTLVDREDVPNAVALQSIQFNLARVIGPVFAGFAFAALGADGCFAINGMSFWVVIVALLVIPSRFTKRYDHPPVWKSLKAGVRIVLRHRTMMTLVLLASAGSFLATPLIILLPLFARDVFHTGAKGYSWMLAYFGIGAVVGALLVASFGNFRHKALKAISVQVIFGLLIAIFAASKNLSVSSMLLFLCGAVQVAVLAIFNSVVQLLVEDDTRGRVMSVYTLAFRGAMPLGYLVAGALAAKFSASRVLFVNGILLAIVAALVLWQRRRELSPI